MCKPCMRLFSARSLTSVISARKFFHWVCLRKRKCKKASLTVRRSFILSRSQLGILLRFCNECCTLNYKEYLKKCKLAYKIKNKDNYLTDEDRFYIRMFYDQSHE